jgi:hypothetical protein
MGHRSTPALLGSLVVLLSIGCTARLEEGAAAGASPASPLPTDGGVTLMPPAELDGAAPIGIRRLTPIELTRSVADALFGGDVAFNGEPVRDGVPQHPFHDESGPHDFDNVASSLVVSQAFAEQLQKFAESVAGKVQTRLGELLPCSTDPGAGRACASEFVERFGPRLYRRPLRASEHESLLLVFDEVLPRETFGAATGAMLEAMLQSPFFLFRTEYGSAAASGSVVALSGYETAAALAYSLWRSSPPDWLQQRAQSGELATRAGIEKAARELLADARADFTLADFFAQWLEVRRAPEVVKEHPRFTASLAQASLLEVHRYVLDGISRNASLADLLTTPSTFLNAELGEVYGLAAGERPSGNELVATQLDPARRAGFLTQPAFLMVHSSPGAFSPIFLGHFVRTKMLCQALPPPPPEVPELSKAENLSTRDRFAQHASAPCAGCHSLMDPIGFGFERYDNIGVYRERERAGNRDVELTGLGELLGTDVDGTFSGPVELAERLSRSAEVKSCFAAQLLKFALGRELTLDQYRLPIDTRSIAALELGTRTLGITEQLVALVTSDAFLFRDASLRPPQE